LLPPEVLLFRAWLGAVLPPLEVPVESGGPHNKVVAQLSLSFLVPQLTSPAPNIDVESVA